MAPSLAMWLRLDVIRNLLIRLEVSDSMDVLRQLNIGRPYPLSVCTVAAKSVERGFLITRGLRDSISLRSWQRGALTCRLHSSRAFKSCGPGPRTGGLLGDPFFLCSWLFFFCAFPAGLHRSRACKSALARGGLPGSGGGRDPSSLPSWIRVASTARAHTVAKRLC